MSNNELKFNIAIFISVIALVIMGISYLYPDPDVAITPEHIKITILFLLMFALLIFMVGVYTNNAFFAFISLMSLILSISFVIVLAIYFEDICEVEYTIGQIKGEHKVFEVEICREFISSAEGFSEPKISEDIKIVKDDDIIQQVMDKEN